MEPLKIIKELHKELGIEGALDVRVTMTDKGIIVKFDNPYSNMPNTFDLKQAILDSAQQNVEIIKLDMEHNDKDIDLQWIYTKRLKFFNMIIERLSPKPMIPDVDHRIPGVGC